MAKNTSQLLGICCYLKLMMANLCTRAQGASFVSGPRFVNTELVSGTKTLEPLK